MRRDLSHPIDSSVRPYPGDPEVSLSPAATHESDGYSVHELRLGSHAGTHVDAPRHTEPEGSTLDARAIEDWVFDALLLDLAPCDAREALAPDAFPDSLDPDVDLLVVRTGWAAHWGEDRYREHPFLSAEFVERCVEAGVGVGLDTFGPDPTPPAPGSAVEPGAPEPEGFAVHHVLLRSDLPLVENLTNLAGLPERFRLYAFPLPLAACDGAPVRAVAEW